MSTKPYALQSEIEFCRFGGTRIRRMAGCAGCFYSWRVGRRGTRWACFHRETVDQSKYKGGTSSCASGDVNRRWSNERAS